MKKIIKAIISFTFIMCLALCTACGVVTPSADTSGENDIGTSQTDIISETGTKELLRTEPAQDIINSNGYVFAYVEDNSTVKIFDGGELLLTGKAQGPCFINYCPRTGTLNMTVTAPGKTESKREYFKADSATKYRDHGNWAGNDSHLYYSETIAHYLGKRTADSDDMLRVKTILERKLAEARELTGKNTKLIILTVTNPATIMYESQYDGEYGPGSVLSKTSVSQFVDYMKGNEDIYVIDARAALLPHTDELIFHQTDTHYTELGAYYCYAEMMKSVLKDFPDAIVHPLTDYSVDYEVGGVGDLVNIMGVAGFYEYTPYLNPKFAEDLQGDILQPKREHSSVGIYTGTFPTFSSINAPNNPTAYLVGDSYSANFSLFASQAFRELYMNEGIMGNIYFHNIAEYKPDYLILVCTERNVNNNLSYYLQINSD